VEFRGIHLGRVFHVTHGLRQGFILAHLVFGDQLSDRLADAQPFLGSLKEDPSLRGLAEVLETALTESDEEAERESVASVLNRMAATLESLQAGTPERPYYTNSSQLPVGYTDDPFEALEMQDDLQRKYTGGTVLHLYMNERISSIDACKRLVKRALGKFHLPYITITPTFSICPEHGYLSGEHEFCPHCDEELIAKIQSEIHYQQPDNQNDHAKGDQHENIIH